MVLYLPQLLSIVFKNYKISSNNNKLSRNARGIQLDIELFETLKLQAAREKIFYIFGKNISKLKDRKILN